MINELSSEAESDLADGRLFFERPFSKTIYTAVRTQTGAKLNEEPDSHREDDADCKVLPISILGEASQDNATENKSRPGRIRTRDQGIMSPLL